MNMLNKWAVSGFFALVVASSFSMPAQGGAPFVLLLPEISTLTAQVGERIAEQLKIQMAQTVAAPRLQRSARTASVTITESNAIVVEATRLPPVDALANADEAQRTTRVRF